MPRLYRVVYYYRGIIDYAYELGVTELDVRHHIDRRFPKAQILAIKPWR